MFLALLSSDKVPLGLKNILSFGGQLSTFVQAHKTSKMATLSWKQEVQIFI